MAERKVVALVGPVLPFRGGIAQHTTRLRQALADVAEVHTFSFSRLYPKAIFPGESDRDVAYDGHAEPDTSYRLDSISPLSWRRTAREIVSLKPDVLLIPWWTVFLAPCFGYIAHRARRAGITVVFLCHNVIEHESASWRRALTRAVLRNGSRFVTQTFCDSENLRAMLPEASVTVRPHPLYDHFPPAKGSIARLAETELLFFGFVRPYKGLDVLIEAMALTTDLDVRLTVAGEVWGDATPFTERVSRLGLSERVEFVSRYLSDEDAAEYFAAADWVVLPYRGATGSGVVPLAYHYDRPVIVTRVGGLPDVVRDGTTGLIAEPESPTSLADTIRRATQTPSATMSDGIQAIKAELSWDTLVRAVLGVPEHP